MTSVLAPSGASQADPGTWASWAPRPDPDHVPEPACSCDTSTLLALNPGTVQAEHVRHSFMCPASVPEYKRIEAQRATVAAWDKASKARARAAAKLALLSTPKGWAAEWRAMQRAVRVVPVDPSDKAINNPVSRYLLAMNERPCYIGVAHESKRSTQLEQHPQTATLGGPCACDRCAAWVEHYKPKGTSTTGAWTCGCVIQGLGTCRVGVDQSVTVEFVNPCARHAGALHFTK